MNKTTFDIMDFCGCNREWALKIQQRMADNGVDFSEISRADFRIAIVRADAELLGETKIDPLETTR